MRPTCRHGNPLANSCSFCEREARGERPGRIIPETPRSSLPILTCETCSYSTVYEDALRRHTCSVNPRATIEETAQGLIESMSAEEMSQIEPIPSDEKPADRAAAKPPSQDRPELKAGKGAGRPRNTTNQKRRNTGRRRVRPASRTRSAARRLTSLLLTAWEWIERASPIRLVSEEDRLEMAQEYLSSLCAKLGIRTPLLIFTETMANPGACGEAGRSTIWLHREYTLTRSWSEVQDTICHEVAHIVVDNTPGMGEAPAHGAEFNAALVIVEAAHHRDHHAGQAPQHSNWPY